MTKKCESSQKQLVECKLFEKCKGAAEQQLVECNLFNHLPATSCQSSHNQLGEVEGFSKCSRHILSDSTVILNLHFHVWLPLLTHSPRKITSFLFAYIFFKFSSYHRASTWALLGMPRCRNIAIVKTTLNAPPLPPLSKRTMSKKDRPLLMNWPPFEKKTLSFVIVNSFSGGNRLWPCCHRCGGRQGGRGVSHRSPIWNLFFSFFSDVTFIGVG